MTSNNVTLLFELSEIIASLEGVFIHIDYEFDQNNLLQNGISFNHNLKIKNINGTSESKNYFSNTNLKKEVSSYLKLNNNQYAIEHFLNAEISPFNSGISSNDYKKLINEYLKNHLSL